MLKNILVTGANGFIGQCLCNQLHEQGLWFRTISRKVITAGNENIRLDLTDDVWPINPCEGIDIVFHLAGKAHALSENVQMEHEYQRINTEATRKLLGAAKKAGVRKFIFFSSVKAAGEAGEIQQDEFSNLPPETPYGKSKLDAEQFVLFGNYVPHPVVIRPCMVYGNSDKGNLPRMIKAIRHGVFPPIAENYNKRSMVHVEDVVQAALLSAEKPQSSGQIYIVTDGNAYSTRQIYAWTREALNKPNLKISVPLKLLKAMALISDIVASLIGRRFVFDSDALQKLTDSAWYSSDKITRELEFVPQHSLKNSLPDIIHNLD